MATSMKNPTDWRPRANAAVLRARARLYGAIRHYFEARGVLEVETPILSAAATVDPHIDSFSTREPGGRQWWLHTSPEFAMKRMLAAGNVSGELLNWIAMLGALDGGLRPAFVEPQEERGHAFGVWCA